MTTKELGILGETKVLSKLIEMGYIVSIPYGDNAPYDFLIQKPNNPILKVQVKTSTQTTEGKTTFELSRRRRNAQGQQNLTYEQEDIDYFILYNVSQDKIYAIPKDKSASHSINIRFVKPKNNNYNNVTMEEDVLIEKIL